MRLFVFLFLALATSLRADELAFETYSCAITMPEGEEWQRDIPHAIEGGTTIFNVARPQQREVFAICVLNNVPALDLANAGVPSVALRTLGSFGFQSTPPTRITHNDIPYLQFIAKRADLADGICVARAALREKTLYLLLMIGRGGPEKAEDQQFLRIMNTFRFLDPASAVPPLSANPLFKKYRLGAYVCAAIAGGLAVLTGIVLLATRRRHRHW
jgi:hypothetical protein